jgi:hypothetical protein
LRGQNEVIWVAYYSLREVWRKFGGSSIFVSFLNFLRLPFAAPCLLDSAHRIWLRVFADAYGLFQRRSVCEVTAMKDNSRVQMLAMRAVDAARACGVSERTFSDWLKSDNPPPHFKRGGCLLVPTRELSEWLSNQITNGGNT